MTTEQQSPPGRLGWAVVLATVAVAVAATVFSVLSLGNALDGRIRDRTIWGVLLVATGAVSPVVALVVLIRRRHIVRQVGERRWGAVARFPGSFVAIWAVIFLGYGLLGTVPRTLIPHTPVFVVRVQPGGGVGFTTIGEYRGSRETRHESHTGRADDIAFSYRVDGDNPDEPPIAFGGFVAPPGAGRTEILGLLDVRVKVRMRVEGLTDVALTINDQSRDAPLELQPGTYRVVLTGAPRRE